MYDYTFGLHVSKSIMLIYFELYFMININLIKIVLCQVLLTHLFQHHSFVIEISHQGCHLFWLVFVVLAMISNRYCWSSSTQFHKHGYMQSSILLAVSEF